MPSPTMKDVAREAGVSTATVSYVLNRKSIVSDETRVRVLEAVERLGYIRNATAQNLRQQRTRLIGFAWSEKARDKPNAILDNFAYHLTRCASEIGCRVLTFTHPDEDPIPNYEDLIRTQRVDAFVITGTEPEDPRIHFLMDEDFPFVTFGRSTPGWAFNWVDTDGDAGMAAGVEYLVSLGHERIAMVGWPESSLSGGYRVAGYRRGLDRAGLPFKPDYLVRTLHSEETGREAFARLCALPAKRRPTAVVCVSDLVAVGVMHEARERGMHLGEDLSVIGFDDEPMSQYLNPALTTLAQPLDEIASMVITILDDLIAGSTVLHQRLIAPRLIVRESTGQRR
ncbi:MAG: LacI family DNA-binding transcriptional regulator [Anaerolineae bacterium]|nr:LacI family DNA-binding transcriptional regulator [Anaerolineae bacterium]NUQ06109.1 LacI family DNA-binding transcriptional regulator [Anaerolineae bacterium]